METDGQLIAQVLHGEREKFGILVERYQRQIYRFLIRMGLDHDETADIMQNAFIKAYSNLKSVREEGSFRCWLYTIAANQAKNYLRQVSRRGVQVSPEALYSVEERDNPELIYERRSLRDRIEEAMVRLSEIQRQVVVLRAFEDLPFKEVAKITNMSLSGVKVTYHRALKKMSISFKIKVSNTKLEAREKGQNEMSA
ncbi:MAG TPA: sigma-70 family RNA polymerase sigma factor [archaeon]|nr:sigma-70 family RNA polymerase sigma factor [archaeon]